jgi:hypothetical protein
VTYGGDGDGLVDNNNALTTMASALKMNELACNHDACVFLSYCFDTLA